MTTLKQLRKGRGLSQESLALSLQGVRGGKGLQGPVSIIEAGKVSPTIRRLSDILTALGYELRVSVIPAESPDLEPLPLDLGPLLGPPLLPKKARPKKLPRAKDAGGLGPNLEPLLVPVPEPEPLPVLTSTGEPELLNGQLPRAKDAGEKPEPEPIPEPVSSPSPDPKPSSLEALLESFLKN